MNTRSISCCAGLGLALLIGALPAAAQGNGKKGSPPGQSKSQAPPPAADPETSSPATAESHAVYVGSWLDDASVIQQGSVWVAISTGYWRFGPARQIDFPVIDTALGTGKRVNVGASLPVYHFDDGTGNAQSGVGETLLYGKVRLRDASKADGRLGVAIAPVIEIASEASQRLSFGVPVSLEVRGDGFRVYGSGGFFTRGAVFASGALERTLSRRLTLTGTIGHSYSTASDPSGNPVDGRHRTDLGIGASAAVTRAAAVFGAVGHSFSSGPSTAGGTWLAGGLSFVVKTR